MGTVQYPLLFQSRNICSDSKIVQLNSAARAALRLRKEVAHSSVLSRPRSRLRPLRNWLSSPPCTINTIINTTNYTCIEAFRFHPTPLPSTTCHPHPSTEELSSRTISPAAGFFRPISSNLWCPTRAGLVMLAPTILSLQLLEENEDWPSIVESVAYDVVTNATPFFHVCGLTQFTQQVA